MLKSARSRRLGWLLGGALVAVVLIIGIFAVFGATMSVSVRNDGTEPLRMSGCSIDDALDLVPGDTGRIDVLQCDREGCSVYDHDGPQAAH